MPVKFVRGVICALNGILYCVKSQRNMKVHLAAAAVVLAFSFYVNLPVEKLLFVIFAIIGVIVAEMFNTSIEAVVDMCTKQYHPLAQIAKDVAAGAVLLAAFNALAIGYFILWPYLRELIC